MKCLVYSDIHLEFGDFEPPVTDADAVFIAGDLHIADKGLSWIKKYFPQTMVFYIPGNHEYYGQEFYDVQRRLKAAEDANLKILLNESAEYMGWKICGGTLWTDFALYGDEKQSRSMAAAKQMMNDYRQIRIADEAGGGWKRLLKPEDTYREYLLAERFLKKILSGQDNSRTIVMTHHMPIPTEHHGKDLLTPAYCVDLRAKIAIWQPALWISGHTHTSLDMKIKKTHLLSNPRGYRGIDENLKFKPALVLEI